MPKYQIWNCNTIFSASNFLKSFDFEGLQYYFVQYTVRTYTVLYILYVLYEYTIYTMYYIYYTYYNICTQCI